MSLDTVTVDAGASELRQLEHRYQVLLDAVQDGVIEVDANGVTTLVNSAATSILRATEGGLLGRPLHAATHPSEPGECELCRCTAANEPQRGHSLFRRADGTRLEVSYTYAPLFDGGRRSGSLFTFREADTARTAESSWLQAESLLVEVQSLARFGDWEWIREGEKERIRWSREIYDIYGRALSLGPASYEEVRKYFTPESWRELSEAVDRAWKDGTPYECDAELSRTDGGARWITARGKPVRDARGRVIGLRGTVQDITGRKRSELELRASLAAKALLAAAVHDTNECVLITNAAGLVEFVNPAFERTSGYSSDELLGTEARRFMSDPGLEMALKDSLARGEVWQGRLQGQCKDGSILEQQATVSPIRNATDGIVGFVAVCRDLAKESQRAQQERFTSEMRTLAQLAGGIAHDFNNILGTLILGIEHQTRRARSPTARAHLEELRAEAERAAQIARQLLLFSRRHVMHAEVLELNAAVSAFASSVRRIVGDAVSVEVKLHPARLFVEADQAMMNHVLLSLAVNARDALPNGGHLTIETSEVLLEPRSPVLPTGLSPGPYATFSLADTGVGIDPATLPHIFEPYFTTREPGRSSGLGLASVFGIVHQHGGFIDVHAEPGRGATFQIYLPTAKRPSDGARPQNPVGGGETILLVEDEAALRKATRTLLVAHGYVVLEAAGGPEALALWQRHSKEIKLLFTDLVMPGGMTGQDLARTLLEEDSRLRVVFTTGHSPMWAGRMADLGEGQGFLQKPADPRRILETIRRCLDSRSEGTTQPPPDVRQDAR
ncbi:MAG: PAS domain S-box protein [Deltaproteobacteria bacterium]|nr:PAS domain S-box protein [Deltaproteobacteria bacterium]